jgi:hypothetical protein
VRDCPFIVRRVAMVSVLSVALPEWDELATCLSRDRELWPIILLMRMDEMDPALASPEDALLIMTGSMLQMLELGGPEAVLDLTRVPAPQRAERHHQGSLPLRVPCGRDHGGLGLARRPASSQEGTSPLVAPEEGRAGKLSFQIGERVDDFPCFESAVPLADAPRRY